MRTLEQFAEWFLKTGILARVPHDAPAHMLDGVTAVTLYRRAPFQVQMFVVPPSHIIPEHTHPNVDSIEVYVGGDIRFSRAGKFLTDEQNHESTSSGVSLLRGFQVRVRPDDLHGGAFGTQGGVFYSIQQWLNGVAPTCVASDYVGVVMGPQHLAAVRTGAPILKRSLTVADAAGRA